MAILLVSIFVGMGILFAVSSSSDMERPSVTIPDSNSAFAGAAHYSNNSIFDDENFGEHSSGSFITPTGDDCNQELISFSSDTEVFDFDS